MPMNKGVRKLLSKTLAAAMIASYFGGLPMKEAEAASTDLLILQEGVNGYTGGMDQGYMREEGPNTGYYGTGQAESFNIRANGSPTNALIYYDLAGLIPQGATIDSAQLSLYNAGNAYDGGTVDLYRVTDADNEGMWAEGTTANVYDKEGAAWLRRTGSGSDVATGWTATAGSTIMDAVVPAATGTMAMTTAIGWETSSDVKSDIQAWVDGTAVNQGWYLRVRSGSPINLQTIASNQYGTAAQRPKLEIQFHVEGQPSYSLQAAITAIGALPQPADLTYADKDAVEAARNLVTTAKQGGATDAEITNLSKLVACEARISELTPPPPVLSAIQTYGNFETAGVDIKFTDPITAETAQMSYKKTSESTYQAGYPFTKYDGNHMATSLFDLAADTAYDIKIVVNGPDGASESYTTVRTKPAFALPTPVRTVNAANQSQLNAAIAAAQPGDHILLDPSGTYNGIALAQKSGTAAHPILIGSQSAQKPVIIGPVSLVQSNYVIVNNLEVHNESGSGILIRGSHYDSVVGNFVHDSYGGAGTYDADIMIMHSEEGSMPGIGGHLIMNNVIGDDDHDAGSGNDAGPRQTYSGIKAMDNPGAFTTIRGNTVYGVADGISPGGDEGTNVKGPNDLDLLLTHPNQNLDVYDNVIYDMRDDGIETDGVLTNSRFFRNRISHTTNSISIAPVYPGPIFIVRNTTNAPKEGNAKMNTAVEGVVRNVFFYNNTFVGGASGVVYQGEPAATQDITFKNNILLAQNARVLSGDMYTGGSYHRNHAFDYDLGYTDLTSGTIYKWATETSDPLDNGRYESFSAFQTATGQEAHGKFGDPLLAMAPLTGYPLSSGLMDERIASGDSPAIDAGAVIPGITNNYTGSAPDMGAAEYDGEIEGGAEAFIEAAIAAIDALPAPADLTLANQHAVADARAWVEEAKTQGAADADITNLQKLADCETKMAQLIDAIPALADIQTYGNFETAGVDIKFSNPITTESAQMYYKKASESTYQAGYPFTKYDGNHMATSLFDLAADTAYDIKIVVNGPKGETEEYAAVQTKPAFALPSPVRTVNAANQSQLDAAIAAAQPGDHILLDPNGTYSGIAVSQKSGTAAHPILIGSQSSQKPVILGQVSLVQSNYVIVNNLEVHNESGSGVLIRGSHYDSIVGNFVHDSYGGPGTYEADIMIMHSDEGSMPGVGGHLIMNNVVGDDDHDAGSGNDSGPRQTYSGIKAMYDPGAFTTIRGNTVYGVADGISPGGDEGTNVKGPDDLDVLQTHPNQNLDVYDNVIYDMRDDGIETDGVLTNSRFFRNTISHTTNSISIAPVYPGPIFVVRNATYAPLEGNVKMNTGVEGVVRNVFFYNNTFVGGSSGAIYQGEPAKTQDIVFKNNILLAQNARVVNGDMYGGGSYHRNHQFDYNLGYTDLTSGTIYKWATETSDPQDNGRYESFAAFQTATGQEAHGKFGDPLLAMSPLAGYPSSTGPMDERIASADSPAIDAGTVIPGITNQYTGSAPDMGASEYEGEAPDSPPALSGADVIENFASPLTLGSGTAFGKGGALTMLTSGAPVFDSSSHRYLEASTPAKSDAYLIASTEALPSKYKISIDIGDIDYDLLNAADEENGLSFLTITGSVPQLGGADTRKVMIDADNNAGGSGGLNPVFFGYRDGVTMNDRFYNGSTSGWGGAWESAASYTPSGWYTFSLEKTDTEYLYTVADAFTHAVIRTASIPVDSVEGSSSPDYFYLGDPFTSYYNGSAKIANIRIQDNSGEPSESAVPSVLTGSDVIENFSSPLSFSDGTAFGAGSALTMETAGAPIFDTSSHQYLSATTTAKSDAYLIRSTDPLPAKYKVSVDIGDIDYDLLNTADEENGMYFISIMSALPQPTTNDWFHENRKVLIDTDNNVWGEGGTHPLFVGYYDSSLGDHFFNGETSAWGGVSDWKSIANYSGERWYTFSLEKTDTDYVYTISDALTHEVIRTASTPISSVYGADLPDYFILGDPHTNYYNGSVKIANIRIQDKSDAPPPGAAQTAATLQAGSGSGAVHNGVGLTVGLTGVDAGFDTFGLTLQYDPAKLEFATQTVETDDGRQYQALSGDAVTSLNPKLQVLGTAVRADGQIRILAASAGDKVASDGDLLALHAKVKEDAEGGTAVSLSDLAITLGGADRTAAGISRTLLIAAPLDGNALSGLIAQAQSVKNAAVEGSAPGQYPAGSKARLQTAINAALAVANNEAATQAAINQAVSDLQQALNLFTGSVIMPQLNKTALSSLIDSAQAKHDYAQEGSKLGMNTAGSKAELQAAIDRAINALGTAAVQSALDNAAAALGDALQTFANSNVTLFPGENHITLKDLSLLAKYYGQTREEADWDLYDTADIYGNGIDIQVLVKAARMILDDWALTASLG